MTALRVGVFADSYRPYVSGVVRSVDLLRDQLESLGHKTYVFAPDYHGSEPEPDVFRFRSVRAITYPSFRIAIPLSANLTRRARSLDLDVVHSHSPFMLGQAGARCAARLGLPLVFTYHTLYDQYLHYAPLGETMWRGMLDRVIRDYCRRCQAIIAPSSGLKRRIRAQGIDTRIEVLPTGICLDAYRTLDRTWLRKRLGVEHGVPLLLTLGRIGPEKNLRFILQTFRIVASRHPETLLAMVGDGPILTDLKEEAREMGLGGRVLFPGPVPPDMVPHCYAGADLFLFSSQSETQGLVLLEAKAAGLPVVTLKNLSSGDLVITRPEEDEDGVVVEDKTPDAMAAVVDRLLSQPERLAAMRANAGKNAPLFSAESWARRIECLYVDVAGMPAVRQMAGQR